MSENHSSPDVWQRVVAALIAGSIAAILIIALLVYLIGLNFSPAIAGIAFFAGALFATVHGFRTRSAAVAGGILGALWLVLEGAGMAFAAIASAIAAALSSFSI